MFDKLAIHYLIDIKQHKKNILIKNGNNILLKQWTKKSQVKS